MERTIRVHVLMNRRTGLLLAESTDLRGLHVVARDEHALMERIREAIRMLLEAEGVDGVTVRPLDSETNGGFVDPNERQFQARAA